MVKRSRDICQNHFSNATRSLQKPIVVIHTQAFGHSPSYRTGDQVIHRREKPTKNDSTLVQKIYRPIILKEYAGGGIFQTQIAISNFNI